MIDVLVVAGGRGRRFGGKKQWFPLKGKPVAAYSLELFDRHPLVSSIYLGAPEEDRKIAEEVLSRHAPSKGRGVYVGGKERCDTVERGLSLVSAPFVAVHDAVRPFFSPEMLDELYRALLGSEAAGAVPAVALHDTVKEVYDNIVVRTLDREKLRAVQTPQLFKTEELVRAYRMVRDRRGLTDDASFVEAVGGKVVVVEGDSKNRKITRAEDLEWALCRLSSLRVGLGYDIHRVRPGDGMKLGGVWIPADISLEGHSDADVLLHAVVDALLGAAGLGDIGELFPDTDERFRGADSIMFVRKAMALVRETGFEVVSLDTVVVAQRPRLSPYKAAIKRSLSELLGTEAVGVKAKTREGLDAVGRGEAVEAFATVLLR